MAITHLVNLLNNDELRDVIQKSNYNFNLVMKTMSATKLKDAADVDEKVRALEAEVADLAHDVSQVAPIADAALLIAGQARDDVADLSTTVTSLQTRMSTAESSIDSLNAAIALIQADIADIQEKLEDHEERITALEGA